MPSSYTGTLATRIKAKSSAVFRAEQLMRLDDLAKHYGVERGNGHWRVETLMELLLNLAQEHVPGFQRDTTGRPRAPLEETYRFFCDVRELMVKVESVTAACEVLAKRPEYKPAKPEALRARFYDRGERQRVMAVALYLNATTEGERVKALRAMAHHEGLNWPTVVTIENG